MIDELLEIRSVADPGRMSEFYWFYSAGEDDITPYTLEKKNLEGSIKNIRRRYVGGQMSVNYNSIERRVVEIFPNNNGKQRLREQIATAEAPV
jgi:hypothetical protein